MLSPQIEVLFSRSLASLRPVIVSFLIVHAMSLSGGLDQALSPCNVLLVGNFCAAMLVLTLFNPASILKEISELPWSIKGLMLLDGALTALISALIFTGLEYTTASNAILIGRMAPVLYALIGALALGTVLSRPVWIGNGFIIVGVLMIVLFSTGGDVNKGDAMMIASTFVFSVVSIIGKKLVARKISMPVLLFARNISGSVIFFFVAIYLFGAHHFADVFAGSLWIVMTFYAGLIIVVSQWLWYKASAELSSVSMGRWAAPAPLVGLTFAYFVNKNVPDSKQLIAAVVILVGIAITTFSKKPSPVTQSVEDKRETSSKADLLMQGDNVVSPSV